MTLRPPYNLGTRSGHRIDTEPAAEPVTLTEVKEQLNITGTDNDDFLTDCISQARQMLENKYNLALITQTWELTLDGWPQTSEKWWDGVRQLPTTELYNSGAPTHLALPRYPLQSVSTITTYAEDDTSTAVTVATVFFSDTASYPGRLVLRTGQSWPTYTRLANGLEIKYIAGFGDAGSDVPITIRRAVINLIGYLFSKRGDGCSTEDALKNSGAASLIGEYVRKRL